MTAVYPSSLPVKDPAGALLSSNPHSTLHDNMYDEIVAIATELGINPSGVTYATVAAWLDVHDAGWTDDSRTTNIVMQNSTYPTFTKNYSRYIRFGNFYYWFFDLTITSTIAQSGYVVLINQPLTLNYQYFLMAGSGFYRRPGSFQYQCQLGQGGTPYMEIHVSHDNAGTFDQRLGVAPAMTVTSGDTIRGYGFFWTTND